MTIRGVFLLAVVIGLLAGLAMATVRVLTSDSGASAPAAATTPDPTATPVAGTPRGVADAWASAWAAGDLALLYELLHPDAKRLYPFDAFAAIYDNLSTEARVLLVSPAVVTADASGARIDVRLATAYFEDIEYTIFLPFTRSDGAIAVDWTPAVVHPELPPGGRFLGSVTWPKRGAILDRHGRPLAITESVRFVGLNRSLVLNRQTVTDALVEFGFSRESIDAAFASPLALNQRVPVGVVGDDRLEEVVDLVRAVPGTMVWLEDRRVHPLGPAAAHVVGYTREYTADELARLRGLGFTIGDRVGAVGLELGMEPVLAGQSGATLRIVDTGGSTVATLYDREFVQGQDITTTLDADLLQRAHELLGEQGGAAVVLDPRTNEILALNSSPSFDPNAFEQNDAAALAAITSAEGQPLANRAAAGLYSAGSTFKLVTGAAGLASGQFSTSDRIFCGATWSGVDPPRRNWEGAQGPLTIAEGLKRSCNPVFYEIALRLYNETDGFLSEMARAFGFGTSTGVVGIDDADGLVPDAEWKSANRGEPWYPGDEVNLGIGQGDLLVTPLQLANAYSSLLAGELRTPVLVQGEVATGRGALPLAPEHIAHLRAGLEMVTAAGGTASWAYASQGYTDFAGKSGTAEDAEDQQHVLFVAYAPKAEPRALAAVVLDEGFSGSIQVGPIARDLVLAALGQ
ncbi:MAG: hypothetical protein Kow0010_11730 [Dehalococcoidia bacterium]